MRPVVNVQAVINVLLVMHALITKIATKHINLKKTSKEWAL